MITAFYHAKLISNGQQSQGLAVLMEGEKIIAVIPESEMPADVRQIDLGGAYLAPAFIDLQIYGSGGRLFGGKPEVAALQQMEDDLLKQGCGGFLATVATNSTDVFEQAITAAKAHRNSSNGLFMGLHFEGPYLNAKRKGAHPANLIKKADLAELKSWVDRAEGEIKMMTLAPELQDEAILDYLNQQGIVISLGHSDANYEQGLYFFDGKVRAATHLFNAMPAMHHREPGLIPALFEQKPYTSIVADGIHVDFAMIKLAKSILKDKLFLITDAVTEAIEGVYKHRLVDGRYVMPDGTLSGSGLTMLKAVQNCVSKVEIPLAEAVNMAALYPAQLLGIDNLYGKIEQGFKANMLILDENLELQSLVYKGDRLKLAAN